jgi:hypothetical protein
MEFDSDGNTRVLEVPAVTQQVSELQVASEPVAVARTSSGGSQTGTERFVTPTPMAGSSGMLPPQQVPTPDTSHKHPPNVPPKYRK